MSRQPPMAHGPASIRSSIGDPNAARLISHGYFDVSPTGSVSSSAPQQSHDDSAERRESRVRFNQEPSVQPTISRDKHAGKDGFYLPARPQAAHDPHAKPSNPEGASRGNTSGRKWRKLPKLPRGQRRPPVDLDAPRNSDCSSDEGSDPETPHAPPSPDPAARPARARRHSYEDFSDTDSDSPPRFPPVSSRRRRFGIRPPEAAYSTKPLTAEEAKLRPPNGPPRRALLRRISSDSSMIRALPRRRSSLYANRPEDENPLDIDDPALKAIQQLGLVDLHRRERMKVKTMPYRERRKYARRAKILFNPDSECYRLSSPRHPFAYIRGMLSVQQPDGLRGDARRGTLQVRRALAPYRGAARRRVQDPRHQIGRAHV